MKQFWYLHSQNVRIINISLNFILKSPPLLAHQIFLQLQYHTKTKHKNRRQKQKMLIVNREMDSVQFTITSMHFDNYLQTKTTQPPQFPYNKFHYPTAQNNIQNNSFRPSTTSRHLPFNKTPLSYLQTRQESSKSTVSSNYLTNDLKNPNLEHKPMHPIPSQIKSQVTANHSYISLAPNGQKTHEQKKYINLSPAKPAGRMTTGLPPQQTPKIQPRRSQSVNDPRLKDAAQNFNAPWFRQSVGVAGSSKNINHLSPFQLNFSNIKVFSDKNNSFCDRKQPSQNINYFKTNDNQWSTNSNLLYTNRGSHYEQGKIEKPYLDLEKQRKMNQIITDSNVTSNESLYKQSSVSLSNNETNRQGNKEDMSKNLTAKAISYVQKDIEKLKNASKRVDQVYHNQISRNYYFNKFLEEKGIKSPEQDKKFELKETKDSKELEKRISSLQKELQQKKNEITDKNKELVDQTKTILDKNKVIDSVSIQLKQYKAKLQNKQKELKNNEKQILELKDKCEQMIVLRKNQQLFYQRIVQYNKKQQTENGLLQKVRKDNEKMKQQLRNIEQSNKKLMNKITKYEQTIGLVQENNKRYLFELNETRQELRIKETQLIINKARLQNQKDIVREQQSTIQQLKKQLKNKENTSQKNILSSQQTNKSAQSRNNEQQIIKLTNKINDLQYKSMELSMLLLNNKVYNHETVVLKIIQMKQSFKISQTLRQKEQQRVQEFHLLRMHQEYVQKKFNELSRQCKKISGKLGVVTSQAQLGWKMLTETNNEVVLLNLKCLNENYKQQAEQIQ